MENNSLPIVKIEFIPWLQNHSYEDDISFTGWIKGYNFSGILGHVVILFDPKRYPELLSENNGVCGLSIKLQAMVSDGSDPKKEQYDDLILHGRSILKEYKTRLINTGKWGQLSEVVKPILFSLPN